MSAKGQDMEPVKASLFQQGHTAISHACSRLFMDLAAEVEHRAATYQATKDAALAVQGTPWLGEFKGMANDASNLSKVCSVLCGELSRRLYGADVCISEELHRHMVKEPGLPAWTQRNPNGGMFFVAKAWAIAEAIGLDLAPMVCRPFMDIEPKR